MGGTGWPDSHRRSQEDGGDLRSHKRNSTGRREGGREEGLEPNAGILMLMDWFYVLCGGGHGNLHV